MKLLLFTLEYPPFKGGIANYYGNLVKCWPLAENIFVLNNNDHKLINNRYLFFKWLPSLKELRKTINKFKIEHILVGQILPLGLAALIINLHGRVKYSVLLHGLDFSLATKFWRKRLITKIILSQAEKIICANGYTSALVKNFLGADFTGKIFTVNPGVNISLNSDHAGTEQLKNRYNLADKFILLSVGRLVKRKGFDYVIDCLPNLNKKIPNLVYVIIGHGQELNHIQSLIEKYHLTDQVIIIEKNSDQERDSWYQLCDIFIMPSRNLKGDYEGFGIVYLEANLAGKPVIAGRSGGVGEAIIDGFNGLMVDSENKNEILEAILKLAHDRNLREKLGRQGRERTIKEFNWLDQVNKIFKIIHQ
jgi:phosphatidyl-myo-inositol dimannoside synthase